MRAESLRRLGAWLAGVWAGLMAGVGLVAAPLLFDVLPRETAGLAAGHLFRLDATVGVGIGTVLLLVGLQMGRESSEAGRGSRLGAEMLLPLGALFCIVVGHFALQPLMPAARSGQGLLSFGALHGLSASFFAMRLALVAVLAWRLTAAAPLSPADAS